MPFSTFFYVRDGEAGKVIGKSGDMMRRIEMIHGTKLHIQQRSPISRENDALRQKLAEVSADNSYLADRTDERRTTATMRLATFMLGGE